MAAGLVIHALAGEQDIRKMAGIGRLMPWTRWAFLAGALALVGLPPFAGFFSKDSIVAAAMTSGWEGWVFWICTLVGAFLTGLYTFRSRARSSASTTTRTRARKAPGRCSSRSASSPSSPSWAAGSSSRRSGRR
jgi:NADH:ubiquinone oxidoreductase subunit 5 (subunit L)/multisubunit Na+/H+ antiporter MnhA subunit